MDGEREREKRMEKGKKEGEEKKEGKFRLKLSGLELGGKILDLKKKIHFPNKHLYILVPAHYLHKFSADVLIAIWDTFTLNFVLI